jgi:hypothetical protein
VSSSDATQHASPVTQKRVRETELNDTVFRVEKTIFPTSRGKLKF